MASLRNLQMRALLIHTIREFFRSRNYLEVDTPCRIPAPMPESAISVQTAGDWFLQTSPEICMKRLLAAGIPAVFQICHAFRQQERGRRHLPEFTLAEWYCRNSDYQDLMAETEALLRTVAAAAGFPGSLSYRGCTIDLSPGWPKISVSEAFERFTPFFLENALAQNRFDELMGTLIEPRLGWEKPVFLYDYPAPEAAAFARGKPESPELAERFELYLGGLELCNGSSELTGTDAYRRRFDREQQSRLQAIPFPEKFLEAAGELPPAAGNALGIDRLAMVFCDAADIREVVAFSPESL